MKFGAEMVVDVAKVARVARVERVVNVAKVAGVERDGHVEGEKRV